MPLKNDNVIALAESFGQSMAARLTPTLRKMAYDSGWPANLIAALQVKVGESGDLFVDYPDYLKDKIEDEEYGTPGQIPNAVIRPFMARCGSIITQGMDASIVDELSDILEVM